MEQFSLMALMITFYYHKSIHLKPSSLWKHGFTHKLMHAIFYHSETQQPMVLSTEHPYLYADGSGNITIQLVASSARVFTLTMGTYVGPKDWVATLVKSGSGANEIFTLTDTDTKLVYIFYGNDISIAATSRGKLKERTTLEYSAAGLNGIQYTYSSTTGYITQVTTADPQGWKLLTKFFGERFRLCGWLLPAI